MKTVREHLLRLLDDDAAATGFQSLAQYRQWLKGEVAKPVRPPESHAHYFFDVSNYDYVDIYRLLEIMNVECPVAQHVFKKSAAAGKRGHKGLRKDWENIKDSAERKLHMIDEDGATYAALAGEAAARERGGDETVDHLEVDIEFPTGWWTPPGHNALVLPYVKKILPMPKVKAGDVHMVGNLEPGESVELTYVDPRWDEGEQRMEAIGQNSNDGLHYRPTGATHMHELSGDFYRVGGSVEVWDRDHDKWVPSQYPERLGDCVALDETATHYHVGSDQFYRMGDVLLTWSRMLEKWVPSNYPDRLAECVVIPDGATHYGLENDDCYAIWLKNTGDEWECWLMKGDTRWSPTETVEDGDVIAHPIPGWAL